MPRQVLIWGVAELVRVLRFLKSHDFIYAQIQNGQGTRPGGATPSSFDAYCDTRTFPTKVSPFQG